MSDLYRAQSDFLACLLDDAAPLPPGWDATRAAGMTVYRNAYRSRLMEVVKGTYQRTAKLVGDAAFAQAAAHHLILHPPSGWTIDLAAQGFADTCSELFANDPDVGELAWLEWAMLAAFTAADARPMTRAGFAAATAGYDEDRWESMGLTLIPGMALRPITFDIAALWRALGDTAADDAQAERLAAAQWLLVWREGEVAVFGQLSAAEGEALADIQRGVPFGLACADALEGAAQTDAAQQAGAMLQRWIDAGLIAAIASPPPPAC